MRSTYKTKLIDFQKKTTCNRNTARCNFKLPMEIVLSKQPVKLTIARKNFGKPLSQLSVAKNAKCGRAGQKVPVAISKSIYATGTEICH